VTHRFQPSIGAFLLLLGACASTPVPDHIDLSGTKLTDARVAIVDMRPPQTKGSRTIEYGGTYRFLADTSIQPALLDLLSSRLAEAIPLAYRNTPIQVVRLDVGLWSDSANVSGLSNTYVPYSPGVPASATAAGLAIGYGLAYALQSLRTRQAAVANFELVVGGYSVTSVDAIPLRGDLSTEQAMQKATNSGIKTIAEKISAMQYWNTPFKKE
jgi:hypothetical protein